MKKFLEEFKTFISRGNVMDMAVRGINFDQLSVKLAGDATLNYGKFITAVINMRGHK